MKLLCLAISSPRSQVKDRLREAGEFANLPGRRGDDRPCVIAAHFDRDGETRMPFHQLCPPNDQGWRGLQYPRVFR